MVAVSHLVFVDESGNSAPGPAISSLWVCAAVAVPFARVRNLEIRLSQVVSANFHPRMKELKGTVMRQNLLHTRTLDQAAADLCGLLTEFETHVWVSTTRAGCRSLQGKGIVFHEPKEIARQLLLERINGFLNLGNYDPASWLIVWDVSDVRELTDFSASVASFENAYTGGPVNPRLFPLILGGLSHDWAGLRLADIVSHLGLHKRGSDLGLNETNSAKAGLFATHVWPRLQKDAGGRTVGWKAWD